MTTLVVSFQPDSGTTEVVTTIFSRLPSKGGKEISPFRLGRKETVINFEESLVLNQRGELPRDIPLAPLKGGICVQ